MGHRILLVEDDPEIAEVILDYFKRGKDAYHMEHASDGVTGMNLIRENDYDLILLDVMLPGINGFRILREMRKTKETAVICITAKVREEDRLLGYELGCDDYVCKPFSLAELYAKVRAVLRRVNNARTGGDAAAGETLTVGKISVNLLTMEAFVNKRKVELSPRELDLLIAFMEHPGWLFSREMLLNKVWGMDYKGTDRTVDNHVKKLRKNLGEAGRQIKTVFGKGYKLLEKEE